MAKERKSDMMEVLRTLDDKLEEICQHIVSNITNLTEFEDEMFENRVCFAVLKIDRENSGGKRNIHI